jgi:hypothetical protein
MEVEQNTSYMSDTDRCNLVFYEIIIKLIYQLASNEFLSFDNAQWSKLLQQRTAAAKVSTRLQVASLPLRQVAKGGGNDEVNILYDNMLCCFKKCVLTFNGVAQVYTVARNPLFSICNTNPTYPDIPYPVLPIDITAPMIEKYVKDVLFDNFDAIIDDTSTFVFRFNDIVRITLRSRFLSIMQQLCHEPLMSATNATLQEIDTAIQMVFPKPIALSLISTTGGLLQTLKSDAFIAWSVSNLVNIMHSKLQEMGQSDYASAFVDFGNQYGSYTFRISIKRLPNNTLCRIYVELQDDICEAGWRGGQRPAVNVMTTLRSMVNFEPTYFAETIAFNISNIKKTYTSILQNVINAFETKLTSINRFLQRLQIIMWDTSFCC